MSAVSIEAPEAVAGPIREVDRVQAMVVTIFGTAILAATAAAGTAALIAGIAAVQALLILGWVLGTSMPGRIGGVIIGSLAVGSADVVVAHWTRSALSPMLATFGLAIPAMFIHQLTRGVVRTRVVESLSGIALIMVIGVSLTGYLVLRHEFDAPIVTVAAIGSAGVAVTVSCLVDFVWARPHFDPAVGRGLTGVALAVAAAAGVAFAVLRDRPEFTVGKGALLCAAIGALAALVSVGISFIAHGLREQDSGRRLRPLPIGLAPLCLVAPVAYLLFLSTG
jgi:hypothetical protein